MKKFYLLVTLTLLSSISFSQITLQKNTCAPVKGDFYSYLVTLSFNSIPDGPSGINQTWDFTTASIIDTIMVYYEDTSASSLANQYPKANIIRKEYRLLSFQEISDSSYIEHGYNHVNYSSVIYTIPRVLLKFPMKYGDSFTNHFEGTYHDIKNNQKYIRKGDEEVTVDGYGKLKLPYGTIDNVLRIKNIATYKDYVGNSIVNSFKETLYLYFHLKTRTEIAYHLKVFKNNSFSSGALSFMTKSYISNVSNIEFNGKKVNMYPNPTSHVVNFDNVEEIETIEIYDTTGCLVRSITTNKSTTQQIDLSDLNKGMYIIVGKGESAQFTKELMIH